MRITFSRSSVVKAGKKDWSWAEGSDGRSVFRWERED